MNFAVYKFKTKLIPLLCFQNPSRPRTNLKIQGSQVGAVLQGSRSSSHVHDQVLTHTVLPHFSFISLKKGNQKQNQDVEDKQYKKIHGGKIIFKILM